MSQTAETLTIEYVSYGRSHAPVKLVYTLDGAQGRGEDRNAPGTPYDLVLRAEWRGSRLQLRTVYLRPGDGDLEITEMISLESAETMVVNVTRTVAGRTRTGSQRWRRPGGL